MLQLFDTSHIEKTGLTNYTNLIVSHEINVDEQISFEYPILDVKSNKIMLKGYIRTLNNEYIIEEKNIIKNDWYQIIGKVNLEDFKTQMLDYDTAAPIRSYRNWSYDSHSNTTTGLTMLSTIGDVIAYQNRSLFTNVQWDYVDHTNVVSEFVNVKRAISLNVCTLYDILAVVKETYIGVELTFDAINRIIHIWSASSSEDKGFYLSEQLNLIDITAQNTSYDFCNQLIPVGKNGLSIILEPRFNSQILEDAGITTSRPEFRRASNSLIDTTNNEKLGLGNKLILGFWESPDCTNIMDLTDDAFKILMIRSAPPTPSYRIQMVRLSHQSKYSHLSCTLGNVISLLAMTKDIKDKQRIVRLDIHPDEPELDTCDVATVSMSLINILARTGKNIGLQSHYIKQETFDGGTA